VSGRHAAPEEDGEGFFEIELQTPAEVEPAPHAGAHRPIEPAVLRADQVGYVRDGRTILDGISMSVSPGQSVAVVGPSGSGKTSLLALLAGLERPDSGTVTRDPSARTGLILQGYGLVSVLTAAENVEAPLQAGALGHLPRVETRERAAAVLAALGLTEVADHLIEELSGGQQQRVAIARALVGEPAVVFADELTAELDHDWKNEVVRLVLDVAHRGGIVVIATHDLELARRCDDAIRLDDGRVAMAG
jgi:ABC-type lipoprotein export system ATPase subunit